MVDPVLFTVFTPTYNRAHTLHRVYDSLCAQTLRDFEWIVIDDGSTDKTAEVVADWVKSADFPVRYFRQEHRASMLRTISRCVKRAENFSCRSISMMPARLARWRAWPITGTLFRTASGRFIAASTAYAEIKTAEIIGDRFPSEPFDTTLRERRYVYRIRGEKWGSTLTDMVRRLPFPKCPAVNSWRKVWFGWIWRRPTKTAASTKSFGRITSTMTHAGETLSKRRSFEDAPGRLHYYIWLLNNDLGYFFNSPAPFLKAAVMLPVVAHLYR